MSGAADGYPGEGVRPPFSLTGTKETAPRSQPRRSLPTQPRSSPTLSAAASPTRATSSSASSRCSTATSGPSRPRRRRAVADARPSSRPAPGSRSPRQSARQARSPGTAAARSTSSGCCSGPPPAPTDVTFVAESGCREFFASPLVRTDAQSRAEIESPRARDPYTLRCKFSSPPVLRVPALQSRRRCSLTAYGLHRQRTTPYRPYIRHESRTNIIRSGSRTLNSFRRNVAHGSTCLHSARTNHYTSD